MLPLSFLLLVAVWHAAIVGSPGSLIPLPLDVVRGVGELLEQGLLVRYVVASLFRVTWGYLAGVFLAIPMGIVIGLSPRLDAALNPIIQILRPISPLAWIPIAILWFGVGDLSAIFLIFLASFFPMVVTSAQAVQQIDPVFLHAGRNFGLTKRRLIHRIVVPAVLPRILVGLRITLGVAWLVVVAAEMIAVSSGLGFLIVDARNAGDRYDLVIAGMVMIGLIGLGLDMAMRRLEQLPSTRWGFAR